MKRLFCLCLIMFTVPLVYSQENRQIDSSYANGYYKQRLEFFHKMPDSKNEIVFLGNSITEAGEWQELCPRKNVINRGISGDVTFGVIARLDEVLSSKPDKIFLLIGINDLKRGIPMSFLIKNYKRIIEQVKKVSPQTHLIIQSILPINESLVGKFYSRITNDKINEVNKQIKQLTSRYNITYIDLHPIFEDSSGQLKKEYATDGIHLKRTSYILWANYLKSKNLL